MITIQQITLVCWGIFFLYWFISARSVKATEETSGPLGGNWYPILLLIGALFIGNFKILARFGLPLDKLAIPLIPQTVLINVLVLILVIGGLVIAIIARRALAANWSAAVVVKKDHELITRGPYHYVRHPIYTGILLMVLSEVLYSGTLGAGIGFLIILLAIWLKLRQEEALLSKHFSEQYSEYRKHTKTLIPFIW